MISYVLQKESTKMELRNSRYEQDKIKFKSQLNSKFYIVKNMLKLVYWLYGIALKILALVSSIFDKRAKVTKILVFVSSNLKKQAKSCEGLKSGDNL